MAEQQFDVIIVGSGAGGGMATNRLANAGLKVALIEAGDFYDPAADEQRTQLRYPWESPRRGASTRLRPFGDFNSCIGGWELDGEPYTQKGDTEFMWWRGRMLGGRTNHWGRISLRFGPLDFKRRDIDGLGDNWPIGYEDIKPYYDKLDKLVGVFGSNEGLYNDPDGFFLPAPKPRLHELYYIEGARKSNVPVIPARKSILTKRINDQRGVCYYCGQCSRACDIHADFSSGTVLVYPTLNGGQVDLFTNSMVREVTTDNEGRATGVSYVNKQDGQEYQMRGRTVVLAASACSSARILLNSKSPQHENGLGNNSDHVGRYLHDSTGASRAAFIPDLMERDIYNEDGVSGMHVYTPWWLENSNLDFPRGYHLEIGGGMGMPSYGFGFAVNQYNQFLGERVGGYGNQLRDDIRRFYGSRLSIACRGESVPQYSNRCELDPTVVDEWGIPVLRFDYQWTQYEIDQARHMQDAMEELLEASGGILLGSKPGAERDYGLTQPGEIIHEVGTTRMGDNPLTSVTNQYGQLHDADNVFVADAGTFVSQADKNPTWTIMALSWRTSDYIIEQMKQRSL
ncbi:MAG: GMC family oxidoreductase [Gammaproteobacteria bacterium]|jgi:choline dehydrogenase-like flavoprotein|nr:GMC family oxidoreductase [Gammaproteobacteria bacterium]HJO10537.1 GMC family oxidoreductase [Gammaproteobacteria bacterium]|tara:strand:+ start:747 stop:2453 length:1707 start_codon:yes stop_codon:yes gene_type:complete